MTNKKTPTAFAEMVFVSEIATQAKFAIRAANQLATTSDSIEIWASIQSILVAAANVSKILWPAKKYKSRGEQLRALLDIEQDNILSDRTIRNHFEHYDERIQKWFEETNSTVYLDSRISSLEPRLLSLPQLFHRDYNPESKVLSFRGESIDLGAVINELTTIQSKSRAFCLP